MRGRVGKDGRPLSGPAGRVPQPPRLQIRRLGPSGTETVFVPPPPPPPLLELPPSPPGTAYVSTPPSFTSLSADFEHVTETFSGSDTSGNTATWSFSNLVPASSTRSKRPGTPIRPPARPMPR